MSQFVSTSEDGVLLTQKGIIVHMLDSDDEVPALFTRLTKEVSFGSDEYYHLRSLCWGIGGSLPESAKQMVGMAVEKSLQQSMALAVLAAVIMLLCTVIQTIFTALAYIKPPES